MKLIARSFACLLVSAGFLAVADEREQLLKAVERAWEAKVDEPVIPRIQLAEGTAFEFIQLMEDAIGEKETSPIVVAVPAAKLSDVRVQVDLKDVPLSAAMATLSEITKLRTSMRDGVWWVEHVEVLDGDFLTRTYRLTPEDLKGIGLEFAAEANPGDGHQLSRVGGKPWLGEGEARAGYFPSSSMLLVRMQKEELAELDALILLRNAGYEGLKVK